MGDPFAMLGMDVNFMQQPSQAHLAAATRLAQRAIRALIAEAVLTPKPALVDQRGCGAHRDMNLSVLVRSARSLEPTFIKMGLAAIGKTPSQELRETLGSIGRMGEAHMLRVTRGVNTHRGAIWVLGLLVAAQAAMGFNVDAAPVASMAARIARHMDRFAPGQKTHGSRVCALYGVTGARGEATSGFPSVIHVGLPRLLAGRARGVDESCARLDALMAIMTCLDDTCLLHRGGLPALRRAQLGARRVLDLGGCSLPDGRGALLALDEDLMTLNASPGGCADLLAACLFLDPAPKPATAAT